MPDALVDGQGFTEAQVQFMRDWFAGFVTPVVRFVYNVATYSDFAKMPFGGVAEAGKRFEDVALVVARKIMERTLSTGAEVEPRLVMIEAFVAAGMPYEEARHLDKALPKESGTA